MVFHCLTGQPSPRHPGSLAFLVRQGKVGKDPNIIQEDLPAVKAGLTLPWSHAPSQDRSPV